LLFWAKQLIISCSRVLIQMSHRANIQHVSSETAITKEEYFWSCRESLVISYSWFFISVFFQEKSYCANMAEPREEELQVFCL
jgi:hypothetical protein